MSSGECLDEERTTTGSSCMGMLGGVLGTDDESEGEDAWESSVDMDESEDAELRRVGARAGSGGGTRWCAPERRACWIDMSASWCARMSSSVMRSSKSSTSRNSRSIRPMSRFPKTPVQSAQWTFLSVESLVYCEKRLDEGRA